MGGILNTIVPSDHDDAGQRMLAEIAALNGVNSVHILPDVHMKDKYLNAGYKCSVPSSCVIVTDHSHYYPQLRSRGIGCGMMVCMTGYQYEKGAEDIFSGFFERIIGRSLADDIAFGVDAFARKVLKRGRTMLPAGRYGVKAEEWWRTVQAGAAGYICGRLSQNDEVAGYVRDAFESAGCHNSGATDADAGHFNPLWMNGSILGVDDIRIGRMFGGNHFLEAQRVAEIYDSEIARRFNIAKNEVTIHSHSCGSMLESCLNSGIVKSHVKQAEYKFMTVEDPVRNSFFHAISLMKNLGSIQRAALYLRLKDTSQVYQQMGRVRIRPVLECTHNDAAIEEIKGGKEIVYRHNVHKLYDDRLTVVSGRWDHPSYLVIAGPNAHLTRHSVDHGMGIHIERYGGKRAAASESVKRLKLYGRIFRLKRKSGSVLMDAVGEEMLNGLAAKGVIKIVARLDPIVNLKMIY